MRACHHVLSVVTFLCFVHLAMASAQEINAQLYRDSVYHFAAIFPDVPQSREVSYLAKDGISRLAQQFYVEQGSNQYLVTVVALPEGPAIDFYAVEHAAAQMRARRSTLRI